MGRESRKDQSRENQGTGDGFYQEQAHPRSSVSIQRTDSDIMDLTRTCGFIRIVNWTALLTQMHSVFTARSEIFDRSRCRQHFWGPFMTVVASATFYGVAFSSSSFTAETKTFNKLAKKASSALGFAAPIEVWNIIGQLLEEQSTGSRGEIPQIFPFIQPCLIPVGQFLHKTCNKNGNNGTTMCNIPYDGVE